MPAPRKFAFAILFLILASALVSCSGNEAAPEPIEEIELVPLVAEPTPTSLPEAWVVNGEIFYQDEFGTSSYRQVGTFTVDESNRIEGSGEGLIEHSGPCFVLTRIYDFNIRGEYDPEMESFLFEELFDDAQAESEEDDGRTNIITDNTFVSCTVGESLGEMFALLRPLILLAQQNHGASALGQVPVPVPPTGSEQYGIDFEGGTYTLLVLRQ